MRKQAKFSVTVVHELNNCAQHRIVTVGSDGTNSAGEWFSVNELATHLNLWASADPSKGLPEVFTVHDKAYQVLS
jgi:hypothetical protein